MITDFDPVRETRRPTSSARGALFDTMSNVRTIRLRNTEAGNTPDALVSRIPMKRQINRLSTSGGNVTRRARAHVSLLLQPSESRSPVRDKSNAEVLDGALR